MLGSLSNVVETASAWYKPQQHFPAIDFYIAQTVGETLEHFDLSVAALGKAIGCPVVKVV